MRIGVVSDTHLPIRAKALPAALLEGLRGVDAILHAGDWSAMEAYRLLARIAPVTGVAGNTDGPEVRAAFGERKVVELGGKRIGLVHGHGAGLTTEKRAARAFAEGETDLIVFGHSHIPVLKTVEGRLLFNPGSPTDKRRQRRYSYGIVEIADGALTARHLFFDEK